jgi:hypothetical protein
MNPETPSGESQASDLATPSPAALQAVLVIHGMGEQIPMDTIKSFVHAVWETDEDIIRKDFANPAEVWSKPDARTGSLELRRITTRESVVSDAFPNGVRTDFYELYWADLTAGSTWDAFTGWVGGLLFRPWSRVPADVRLAWIVLWIASLAVLALAILGVAGADFFEEQGFPFLARYHWLVAAASAALLGVVHKAATATFGRVVRYTRAQPENIAARQAVRERGLKLLNALHSGNNYTRIVVVSHSLGTILAHDLISYFWAQRSAARTFEEGTEEFGTLCRLEEVAAKIDEGSPPPALLKEFSDVQYRLRQFLASRPAPAGDAQPDRRWLITDFVTLGSPLTHAEFLLAADREDLDLRIEQRELPVSPPFRELLDPKIIVRARASGGMPLLPPPPRSKLFSYPDPGRPRIWFLHHAAPFAALRWTNIFDPARLVFFGDLIGGPLAPVLGPAIVDVDLRALRKRQSWRFTHTQYWQITKDKRHIEELRKAVNLLNKKSP